MRWRSVVDAALDLLLPSVCPACRVAAGPAVCPACIDVVPRPQDPCPWCGAPRQAAPEGGGAADDADPDAPVPGACSACRNRGLPGIALVHVGCVYAGVVEELVGNAKAGARPAAVRACGQLMPTPPRRPGMVAVPIPAARGRRPGPHLATALARALARRMDVPFRRLLRTTRLAAEQHLLGHSERRRNVDALFASRPAPPQVLLVDDLVTTGATAVAAASALRAAGATRVELVCLARTPRAGERIVAATGS